jgi:hypothetical protein
VLIKKSNGEFAASTECNGASPTVVQNQNCFVKMSTLTIDPFKLVLGDLVVAMVKATNEKGTG